MSSVLSCSSFFHNKCVESFLSAIEEWILFLYQNNGYSIDLNMSAICSLAYELDFFVG